MPFQREFLLDPEGENHQTKSRSLIWKVNGVHQNDFGLGTDMVQRSRCSLHTVFTQGCDRLSSQTVIEVETKSSVSELHHGEILTVVPTVRFGMCGRWVVRGFSFLKAKFSFGV